MKKVLIGLCFMLFSLMVFAQTSEHETSLLDKILPFLIGGVILSFIGGIFSFIGEFFRFIEEKRAQKKLQENATEFIGKKLIFTHLQDKNNNNIPLTNYIGTVTIFINWFFKSKKLKEFYNELKLQKEFYNSKPINVIFLYHETTNDDEYFNIEKITNELINNGIEIPISILCDNSKQVNNYFGLIDFSSFIIGENGLIISILYKKENLYQIVSNYFQTKNCKDNMEHNWSYCLCSNCGEVREQHKWIGCKCNICKKTIDNDHDWTKNCNYCSVCGKTRANNHIFANGFCSKCGTESNESTYIDERDGYQYKTIKIGNQIWLAENLCFKAEYGCWVYDNKEENRKKYGYLYNWRTASNVAPKGWHLPSDDEWDVLINFLGGYSIAGGKMKEAGTTHWQNPNLGATNSSGFAAMPGGIRSFDGGSFDNMGTNGYYWSSTGKRCSLGARNRHLIYGSADVYSTNDGRKFGFSVRCVRD